VTDDQKRWGDGTPILRGDVAEPWGSVPAERWVRVRAEIISGGLWDVSGCGRWAEDLPISAELRARIDRWREWHDDLDDRNDSFPKPFYWEQRDDMPTAAFNAEGRAIGRALKAELPDDWTVIVVDVDAWCRPEGAPDTDDRELVLRGERRAGDE
jgi:hypothetical protein